MHGHVVFLQMARHTARLQGYLQPHHDRRRYLLQFQRGAATVSFLQRVSEDQIINSKSYSSHKLIS